MQTETIGPLIRRLRIERHWDQTSLADAAGMPRSSLAGIETGRVKRPSVDVLERIAAVLHIHPHILLAAAGYRVATPPPIKPRTFADTLGELAAQAKEMQTKADTGDADAQSELRWLAQKLSHVRI